MSVEQPEGQQDKSWAAFYEKLGKEISVKIFGFVVVIALIGSCITSSSEATDCRLGYYIEQRCSTNGGMVRGISTVSAQQCRTICIGQSSENRNGDCVRGKCCCKY
ncbi:hypothetical protein FOCC_FOCC008716 [Frankliniella occidentalis]|nr:hypothetical protein FOCC_FOCC008716 [Frankliniella occidentalis]